MKRWLSAGLTVLIVATGLAVAPAQSAAAAECTPRVELLPLDGDSRAPSEYPQDEVYGLGGPGNLAVGSANKRPAYWRDGKLKLVPLPPGFEQGEVRDVNRFGLMVGSISEPGSNLGRAFRYWVGQRSIDLYPKGEDAISINDAGRVLVTGSDYTNPAYEYWHGTQIRRMLRMPGVDNFNPFAINNASQIVGSAVVASREVAVSWSGDVDPLGRRMAPVVDPSADTWVTATDIDQRGRVVGYKYESLPTGERRTGLLWSSVGDPAPDELGMKIALDISPSTGVVVGLDKESGPPVIWRGSGSPIPLPLPSGTQSSSPTSVTDDGRVGGHIVVNNRIQPVIWHCTQNLPATAS